MSMKTTRNIKGFVNKRAHELYFEWREDHKVAEIPCFEQFRLEALIEYLENEGIRKIPIHKAGKLEVISNWDEDKEYDE